MKYTFMDSITLYDVLDYMDTLSIDDRTKERYEAALVSESIRHEMLKLPFNSHPTNFKPEDITNIDNIISEYIFSKWNPVFKGLNCKLMVQNLYRKSDERCYYFPTTNGIRREIKIYVLFGDTRHLNKIKLTNPELYNSMEPIGRRVN